MFLKAATLSVLLGIANAQTWKDLPGSLYGPAEPWGFAPEASWPPTTEIGKELEPQKPDALTRDIIAQVDQDSVESIITKLAGFGTRHTLSTQNSSTRGIGAARDWIYNEMRDYASQGNGSMNVYFNSYIQPVASRILFPVNITNVIAQINGSSDPNRVHIVTAHYDSRRLNVSDYTNDAPGADDDASGVAVVMEMARICAKQKPKATMIFAAVAGEEQGLYGADHLAKTLKAAGYNVEGNWNVDTVGSGSNEPFTPINEHTIRVFGASILSPNISTGSYSSTIGTIGGENDSPHRNLGRFIAEVAAGASEEVDMQVALIYRLDRFLRGGDHRRFLEQGFPAVRFTEAVEEFKHQHQDIRVVNGTQYGDTLEFVDFAYTSRVAKVNLATMWSAANAPAMPRNVTISTNVGFTAADENTPEDIVNNLSAFSWAAASDPLVAGYELVWRVSGALQWSHSLDVGNVGNVTVDLSKDSLQFGVRAVGHDGKKSPAVFPFPGQ